MSSTTLYLGIKGHVVAFDKNDGRKLWQTKLKKSSLSGNHFVIVLAEGKRVFAHSGGELSCLDAETGSILWNDPLTGLGYEIATIATDTSSTNPGTIAAIRQKRNSDASAAGV